MKPTSSPALVPATPDPSEPLRHGAYLCLRVPAREREAVAPAAVGALAERVGLANEFDASTGHPSHAVAYLRRVEASPGPLADDLLLQADAVVHVASSAAETVEAFCGGIRALLGPAVGVRVLRGVVRPTRYTGNAMQAFAYAHQVVQGPGAAMPHAFLVPMRKTPEWWAKDWMERHTYFLPRYDEEGRMRHQGHALAAAAGIPVLLRRTYRAEVEPAPDDEYDFVNYFECADAAVPTFHQVCAALRDVERNPEWRFVREGPTWHGRRVASWAELFT